MNARQLSVWRIARLAGVSPRWARARYKRYLREGAPPELKRCGRKPLPTPDALKEKVIRERREFPCGARAMEQHFKRQRISLSHNRIHAVLREAKLAKREPKKSKKRKWVRYERHKANSLWHTDWKDLQGKQLILFEDDATRLITGYGLFDSAIAEYALQVFAVAVAKWGKPRQLLSDNGPQFCNTHDNKDKTHLFHGAVSRAGVDHIFTRPAHPQSNGKLEKLNHTIEKFYVHFGGDLEKAVQAYNEKHLHMSLDWHTPHEAWLAKEAKGLKYQKLTKT